MGDDGLEHPHGNTGETVISEKGGAESGAVGQDLGAFDADLAAVVTAWPNLTAGARAAILDVVREAGGAD